MDDLTTTVERFDADHAARMGVVHEVHSPEAAAVRLRTLCSLLTTERSLLSQMASKAMIDAVAADGHVPEGLASQWTAAMTSGPDRTEGVAAFLERRSPMFTWTPSDD